MLQKNQTGGQETVCTPQKKREESLPALLALKSLERARAATQKRDRDMPRSSGGGGGDERRPAGGCLIRLADVASRRFVAISLVIVALFYFGTVIALAVFVSCSTSSQHVWGKSFVWSSAAAPLRASKALLLLRGGDPLQVKKTSAIEPLPPPWVETPGLRPKLMLANSGEPKDKLCVVVPYRDGCSVLNQGTNRWSHLQVFTHYMESFLPRANPTLDFVIIIAEQARRGLFNRGQLMNAGFMVGKMRHRCTYYIFHDVDHLPLNYGNDYSNSAAKLERPHRLSSGASVHGYKVPYADFIGCAIVFTGEQYESINGMTNIMYGWGKEDENLNDRIRAKFGIAIQAEGDAHLYLSLPHDNIDATTKENTTTEDPRNIPDDKLEVSEFQAQKLRLRYNRVAPLDPEAQRRGILGPADDGLSSLYRYQVKWDNVTVVESRSRFEHFVLEILARNLTRMSPC